MRVGVVGAVVLCVLTIVPALAGAQAPEDAEQMITHGVELRREGRDEEALALFTKAYAAHPSARAEAQRGLAL